MEVILNSIDMELGRLMGEQRHARKRSVGARHRAGGGVGTVDADVLAARAEVAFCRAINVYPDTAIHNGGDGGFDCVTYSPRRQVYLTIDVKSITEPHHNLVVDTDTQSKADLYALVYCEAPRFVVYGYATQKTVFDADNIQDLGYGPRHVVQRFDLSPIALKGKR